MQVTYQYYDEYSPNQMGNHLNLNSFKFILLVIVYITHNTFGTSILSTTVTSSNSSKILPSNRFK